VVEAQSAMGGSEAGVQTDMSGHSMGVNGARNCIKVGLSYTINAHHLGRVILSNLQHPVEFSHRYDYFAIQEVQLSVELELNSHIHKYISGWNAQWEAAFNTLLGSFAS
jgi:hypothetical protein